MSTLAILNGILTSTLPSTNFTTEEPSIFGENGLTLLIIASILTLVLLMILCCFCASHPSGGNGSRRIQSVLPTRAPTQTTVTRTQSTIYANKKGQPILKSYKVSTHSTSSGESIHPLQSQTNLIPSSSNHHHHYQGQQQQERNTNPFYDIPLQQQQHENTNPFYDTPLQQQHENTNPFYDIPLDTVCAPRKLTQDYYARQGLRQY